MPEAVLAHVVARPEQERLPDLLLGPEQLGRRLRAGHRPRGRGRLRARRERTELGDALAGRRRALAVPRVAQTGRGGRLDVDVADQQRLGELRSPCDDVALVVDDERVAVEDELVLTADERAERDCRDRVLGPLRDHLLALRALAGVVRRGRDVHDQPRAGQRLVAERCARDPDVLADGDPDRHAVDVDQRAALAALEVAVLVEDAVVGQAVLAIDALHGAVGDDCGGVEDVVVAFREADDRDEAADRLRDPLERRPRVRQEVGLQQQVLRRVPGDRQLREEDDLSPGGRGALQVVEDQPLVALEVADDGVDLREGDPHAH